MSEKFILDRFEYTLVVDEESEYAKKLKSLDEVKQYVAEKVNLNFANYYLDLFSTEEVIVQGY